MTQNNTQQKTRLEIIKQQTPLKNGGARCRYCGKSIYIPSMGNLRDVINRHEDKCFDNPNRSRTT